MKLSAAEKLRIYRETLKRYEATDDPMTDVQQRLIADLERQVKSQ